MMTVEEALLIADEQPADCTWPPANIALEILAREVRILNAALAEMTEACDDARQHALDCATALGD